MTDHSNVSEVRLGALDRGVPTYQQTRPVEYHEIASQAGGAGGANYTYPATYFDLKGLEVQLSFQAVAVALVVGAANVTVRFYERKDIAGVATYFLLETMAAVNSPAVVAGSVGKLVITPTVAGATHFTVTGVVAVAINSTVYFAYDLLEKNDVQISVGDIEIGAVELKDGVTDRRATVNQDLEVLVKDWDARPTGWDIFVYTGTRFADTQIDFAVNAASTAPTIADIATVKVRTSGGLKVDVPLNTIASVAVNGAHPNYRMTITGAVIPAGALIKVFIRDFFRAFIMTTNSLRSGEISPIDTRSVLATWLALNTALVKNTTYYYPAATYLDTYSANANGGKANFIGVTGRFTTKNEAASTVTITFEGTNDPAKTAGHEAPFRFFDNSIGVGTAVDNVVVPINTVSPGRQYAFDLNEINYRYIRMKVVVGNCASDLAAEQSIFASYDY